MNDFSEIDLGLPRGIGHKILHFRSIDSTNNYLRKHVNSFTEGTVILADTQTSGRGRGLNRWESPYQKGLYFSVLLKPDAPQDDVQLLSLMITLAVRKGVEDVAVKNLQKRAILDIKWPNDLFYDGKKWCGILIEGITQNNIVNLIAGIGVNVATIDDSFDSNTRKVITSLDDIYNFKFMHQEILKSLLLNLEEYYRNFNPKAFVEEYKLFCSIWGKWGTLIIGNRRWRGVCKSITDKGELIMKVEGKSKNFINGTLLVEW